MSDLPTHRRRLLALSSAVLLALSMVTPALAYIAEVDYRNCGQFIAYVHYRYNDTGVSWGPGESTGAAYLEDDNQWHVRENNGLYAGWWEARGNPQLDTVNTWAGCRNFG